MQHRSMTWFLLSLSLLYRWANNVAQEIRRTQFSLSSQQWIAIQVTECYLFSRAHGERLNFTRIIIFSLSTSSSIDSDRTCRQVSASEMKWYSSTCTHKRVCTVMNEWMWMCDKLQFATLWLDTVWKYATTQQVIAFCSECICIGKGHELIWPVSVHSDLKKDERFIFYPLSLSLSLSLHVSTCVSASRSFSLTTRISEWERRAQLITGITREEKPVCRENTVHCSQCE